LTEAISGSATYKIDDLVSALAKKDVKVALAELNEATGNGMDLSYLLVNLMRALRDKLLEGSLELGATKLIFTLDDVARRQATSLDGELLIQVAIVEWCGTEDIQHVGKPVSQKSSESEGKSAWLAMKEKINSGEKIGQSGDIIDEARAIFSN
jgi:hypothetical protein